MTSPNVEVKVTDTLKGKGLYATRRLEVGTIIFEEDPLVSCQFSWNAAYQYRACDHCLKPLETAEENAKRLAGNPNLELMYTECCTTNKSKIISCVMCAVQYCSAECRAAAYAQYHRTLCMRTTERNSVHPIEQLNEAWKQMHYPPETSTIMLIVRLLASIIQSPNREAAIEQTLQFCHRTVNEDAELAHKLLGEKFVNQQTLLHNLLLATVPHEGIEQFLTPAGFQGLLALIGTNAQGVGTSAVSQWVTRCSDLDLSVNDREVLDKVIDRLYDQMDAHSGNFLNNEGVGLYTLQSAANHSCDPNSEPAYLHNNHRLSLVALRDIELGEEICISYLDEVNLSRSRHSRQKELKENYLFTCNCSRCEEQAHDLDVTSEEEDPDEEEEDEDDEEMVEG